VDDRERANGRPGGEDAVQRRMGETDANPLNSGSPSASADGEPTEPGSTEESADQAGPAEKAESADQSGRPEPSTEPTARTPVLDNTEPKTESAPTNGRSDLPPTAEVPPAGAPFPVLTPQWPVPAGAPALVPNGPGGEPVTGRADLGARGLPVVGPYGALPAGYDLPAGQGGGVTPPPAPRSGGTWRWAVVALVAALIGGGVGGGIVAATASKGTNTVKEIAPGPALLNGTTNVQAVVAKVLPAVVAIDAKSTSTSSSGLGFPGTPAQTQEDQGSGMIITSTGEVVTNNHVIAGATTITVTLYGQTRALPATLVDTDPTNDVALLQITGQANLPTVSYADSDAAQVGDGVVAIGNALGISLSTPTVTQGIISAKGRTVTASDSSGSATETLTDMFQTDAAINPGNSGGPLVDSSGKVIAMNTAVAAATGGSGGTSEAQGIGFAIPSNKIQNLLPGLRNQSIGSPAKPSTGFLGVSLESVSPQLRSAYGFVPTQGAVVTQVESGSPAGAAGIQIGDVIVSLDGKSVTSADQLAVAIQNDMPGQHVKIGMYRGQKQVTVTAILTANPSGSS
jgi:S1-C subfamily serine protease